MLYVIACQLYRSKLPLDEDDLSELLRTARHTCGHGADTRPPFDLSRDHMRSNGYSPTLAAAIHDFVENLPSSRATKVRELRRSARLIAVLDSTRPIVGNTRRVPWSETLRQGIAELRGAELAAWQRLILAMSATDRMGLPATWRRQAEAAIDELGVEPILNRLASWWPDSSQEVCLDGGAIVLMKHLIWMAGLLPRTQTEPLVAEIADMRWHPKREPLGIVKPAIAFLETATSPTGAEALARLRQRLDG